MTTAEARELLNVSESTMRKIAQNVGNEKYCKKSGGVYLITYDYIKKEMDKRDLK